MAEDVYGQFVHGPHPADENPSGGSEDEELRKANNEKEVALEENNVKEFASEENDEKEVASEENKEKEVAPEENNEKEVVSEENNEKEIAPEENNEKEVVSEENNVKEVAPEENNEKEVALEENNEKEVASEENNEKEVASEENNEKEVASEENNEKEVALEENSEKEVASEENNEKEVASEENNEKEVASEENNEKEVASEENNEKEVASEENNEKEVASEENNKEVALEESDSGSSEDEESRKVNNEKEVASEGSDSGDSVYEELREEDIGKIGTDLLHPLATLTWEHCCKPPWKDMKKNHYYPRHVATLHEIVAVLTTSGLIGDFYVPDILFLSSTDLRLQSWTSIALSDEGMSLTTYQSLLVLVGGRDRSTREPTNKVLTSTTGQVWKPSLPPMPTKRCATSLVSTRSPEVLVVAGGRGSNDENLDVVEVLQGDKWLTVDPLPTPASWMRSTLNDGNICFMRLEDSTVITCSCTSLISSCSKFSGNSFTDRPLWQQFKAPGGGLDTAIASCSLRLVFIDHQETVRGYSSMIQSWQATTSTGPIPDRDGDIAVTVLNTGELILAHQYGGVYKGAVSVSLFSPDSRFLSEDLIRLEAVMGVQIVSVLASHVSELASLSGVTPLPQPLSQSEEYVEKLISQWCDGLSSVSPTWKHLLEVISGVGLPELRAEIEAFMKGDLKCHAIMRLFQGEFPANEAKELGTYLEVPHANIQEFRQNNMSDAKGMLIDVLDYWLETDPKKSWSKLAEAVEDCGYGVLAKKIRQKSLQ